MSEVFFIGDTHFGHRGIIQFSELPPHRPFAAIEEHDADLAARATDFRPGQPDYRSDRQDREAGATKTGRRGGMVPQANNQMNRQ